MPKQKSIKSVLIIGSGPIVIGQACEFDYSGSQASRSLREEGIEVSLINSNPATIMTDNVVADHIYLLPLTSESILKILKDKTISFDKLPESIRKGVNVYKGSITHKGLAESLNMPYKSLDNCLN